MTPDVKRPPLSFKESGGQFGNGSDAASLSCLWTAPFASICFDCRVAAPVTVRR
tara:strand:+ start:15093 stop:15254 length:162 start_codon:yes stop_codon:yes gene_type:complete